jgi:ABC-type lipoprotein release transport system permease subunit
MDPDPAQLVRPVDLVDGRFLQLGDTTTVVISQRLAEVLGLRVGDVLHLPGAAGQVPLTVIGVLRATPVPGPEAVYVTIETAQRILNLPGLINGIEVMVQAGVEREAVQARLLERLGPGYTTTLPEFGQEFATSMQLGERIFQTIGILALIMVGSLSSTPSAPWSPNAATI